MLYPFTVVLEYPDSDPTDPNYWSAQVMAAGWRQAVEVARREFGHMQVDGNPCHADRIPDEDMALVLVFEGTAVFCVGPADTLPMEYIPSEHQEQPAQDRLD